ncbi:MAG: glycosyltransferase family A protein [Candidatus Paceibacterota bacterium]
MKKSVVIISHNEEKYIAKCILSILNQTDKPDEVILVVHNSTDETYKIAKEFPIIIVPLNGEPGPVYARMEAIKNASGEIILCIDGDSVAESNWVEVMSKTLERNDNILIGSYIKIKGTIFDAISNIFNKYFCITKNSKATRWLWGASFAFFSKDKDLVLNILEKSINPSKELNLPAGRIAEDYWLALFMNKKGNLEITNKTYVTAYSKEPSIIKAILRSIANHRNGYIMGKFFKNNSIINL